MSEPEVMFANIEYEPRSNKIHLWEIVDGKKTHLEIPYQHNYYISDDNGTCFDMYGNRMTKATAKRRKDAESSINILPSNTIIAESDISEPIKYLHERYNFTNLKPNPDYINTMTFDIEVEASDEFPKATEVKYAINAISAYFSRSNKLVVMTYSAEGKKYQNKITVDEIYEQTKGYRDKNGERVYEGVKLDSYDLYEFTNELQMLESFCTIVKKESIDIITGWYIEQFDIPYLINRMAALGSMAWQKLSPIKKVERDNYGHYIIKGVSVLDYLKVYKDRFTFDNKGSYSLNNICNIEIRKSKLEYEGTISDLWKTDWDTFITYNIIDTLRVVELDRKLKFITLIVIMTHESLIPYVGILGTLQDHLGLLLRFLAKQGKVLNNREENEVKKFPGAFVYANQGLYRYVISFDVTSLYPTIIIRDNIGQETLIHNPETEHYVEVSKNGFRLLIMATVMMTVIREHQEIRIPAGEIMETDIIRI